ncbi:adhesion G protein-coupled receptor L3-like [Haliotis rubra]|uniref:adhesion G protein-coupled receptor L3-like n=1 Tax=Haliotis rubra TaxID=36100 RepID=UPI001EE588AD|nr:adhesion G protein-coupled receptor L3-like [Haliotis rubra]
MENPSHRFYIYFDSKSSTNNVNVHFILIFPNGDNSASAVTELTRSINNGSVGSMRVNETSLIISNRVGSTQVSQIEYSSPNASNTPESTKDNTEIQLTCNGTFVQPVGDVTMEWRMTSRNALVVPLSNSRLQTNLTSPYEGHYVGTLTAANILFKDSGDFQCSLRDEGGLISSQEMNVLVIPRPVVTLLPMKSVVIRSGEDITLSCNLTRSSVLESTPTFHWYQNGLMTVGTSSRLSVTGGGFQNATYFCEGENDVGLGERSQSTTVTIIGAEVLRCDKEGNWHGTRAGSTAEYPCPTGGTAVITRHCGDDGQWLDEDSGQCAVRRLERVIDDIEWIEEGLRVANISSVARAISESTQPNELSSKWIVLSLQALGRLLNLIEGCIVTDSKVDTKQFIEVYIFFVLKTIKTKDFWGFLASVSNILDSRTVGEWKKLKDTATSQTTVLQLLDRMTDVTTNCLDEGDVFTAESTNIELKVGKTDPAAVKGIEFSTNSDSNTGTSKANLKLDSKTLKQLTDDGLWGLYRCVSKIQLNVLQEHLISTSDRGQVVEPAGGATGKNGSRRLVVNSGLLAFNLFPAPTKALDPPLKMTLMHTDLSLTGEDRMCVYLNTSQGLWDSKGCNVSMSGTSSTECSCGHLTNFAVLMSPDAKQILIRHPLTPAEIACCSVAIVLLVITVVVYAVTWRYIRSDQGVIVIHICVCLAVALLLLLIGIGRDEFGLCIAFAVAVHFFYMATFFMMLASGLEALLSDSNLLRNTSKLKPLLIGAWGLTVLAVIISCSQLQVYEPDLHCWLSLMGDMKWLFIVPVLLILIVNFVVTGKMIHNHLARRAARLQDDQGKEAKSLHWMCFMIPVLGLSWIFGLLTVQDGSDVYDYLFAIINVLQGLIIFITQCIANKHVRKGIASLRRPRDQGTTERELEMDASREDADMQNDVRASGAYHYIDNTQRSSGATDLQQYESLEASQHIGNVYEDMDRTATQTGLFAKDFSEETQYANEQANPVGGANRMPDPAKSGDGGKLPSDVLYRKIQDTERRPMIPSHGNRR